MATARGRAATAMASALMNAEKQALKYFPHAVAVIDLNCPKEQLLTCHSVGGITFPSMLSKCPSSSYIEG